MHKQIWTPDAPTPAVSPNIKHIDPREMLIIRSMHQIAQNHDIVLACSRCRQPFQGLNAAFDKIVAIECGCRELRSDNKSPTPAPEPIPGQQSPVGQQDLG